MDHKWWLITWTTYGSWLPGDPRGFCTWRGKEYIPPPRRYARPGEAVYDSGQYVERHTQAASIVATMVRLTAEQQQLVLQTIVEEINAIPIVSAVTSVGPLHVHWLACFGDRPIRATVGRIKAAASRLLNAMGFKGKRLWTKNCHMESKSTESEFESAFDYVCRHIDEGCLIHTWPPYLVNGLAVGRDKTGMSAINRRRGF
jgi:hypothetical protein